MPETGPGESNRRRGVIPAAFFLVLAILPALCGAQDAGALRLRHDQLRSELASNAFQRPLHLESSETASELRGDIYSRVDQPFAVVNRALEDPATWCEILILHLNVKHCATASGAGGETLELRVGRKFDRPLSEAFPFLFRFRRVATDAAYLHVELDADAGPLGTHHYLISMELLELAPGSCFLHLSYAYAFGMPARLAMEGYLKTIGRDKVGFTISGHNPDGTPAYQAGTRGVIERNTMRYYLAIEAWLGALGVPAAQQQEKRLQDWFTAIERYPQQLHDLERAEYIDMKHGEIAR